MRSERPRAERRKSQPTVQSTGSPVLFGRLGGVLVLLGVAVFVWAGARHPDMATELGPFDSPEYFTRLAAVIGHHRDWSTIHAGLLVGPLLWALGSAALVARLHRQGEHRYSVVGGAALAVGSVLWAVAFVFAAFVLPAHAAAVRASDGGTLAVAVAGLRGAQAVAFRLGLVALVVIGVGMASMAASLLYSRHGGPVFRRAAGSAGVLLGVWPLVAWAAGIFQPSPFTSALWAPTAILTSGWFTAVGIGLLAADADRSDPTLLASTGGAGGKLVAAQALPEAS